MQTLESHRVSWQSRNRRTTFLALGSISILAFLAEGILSKSNVPGIRLGFIQHMSATVCLLFLLGYAWLYCPIHDFKRTASAGLLRVRYHVAAICGWTLISTLAQTDEFLPANIAFWTIWSANLFAIWWIVPVLVGNFSVQDRLRLIQLVVFSVVTFCILLHPLNGYQQGRLVGMFVNASHSGRMLALAVVTCFTIWLTSPRQQMWQVAFLLAAAVLLVMTRTRASIASATVACAAVFLTVQFSNNSWKQSSTGRKTGIVLFILVTAAFVGWLTIDLSEATTFLRVDGGITGVIASRTMNWSRGFGEFDEYGILGGGFMSRFGDTSNPLVIGGISVPKYDWLTADDPMNMWMSMAKQSGIPAMIVLLFIVIAIWQMRSQMTDFPSRCLVTGFLVSGLVFGSVDGNWLLSFGHPVDRFSMVVFAILGSIPRNSFARNQLNRIARQKQLTAKDTCKDVIALSLPGRQTAVTR